METGYRRRILIEPMPGRVTAELEDDYHRMVVTLVHADGVLTAVDSEMKRWPWTTCRGAIDQLGSTFVGVAIADVAKRGEKKQNCTHLHDLAIFAAAHAGETVAVAFDVLVADPVDGMRTARLARNGVAMLDWMLSGDLFLAPAALAGRRIGDLNDVIASLGSVEAEAVRILRWASILAQGRAMDIPAGLSAAVFPVGACYTFQPERALVATRLPGADLDFSRSGKAPLSDREHMFR